MTQSILERQLEASVTEVQQKKGLAKVDPAPLARPQESGIGVDELVARVAKVREVQSRVMKKGHHYGMVPGVEKPTLLKPGAELLGLTFQLDPDFSATDRWDGDHLESVVKCTLYHAPTGTRLGSGIGSCSTKEKKYAWRGGGRKCPECGSATALLKSKQEDGFFCWTKKDGCGAKFKKDDQRITSQAVGRVQNPDLADQYNTVRKMACKRAHVAAILFVTCASEIFTQDVEDTHDMPEGGREDMHTYPDEERGAAAKECPEWEAIMKTLRDLEVEVQKANPVTWQHIARWRGTLGIKGKPSELGQRVSRLHESTDISAGQRADMMKLLKSVNRQVKRHEDIAPPPPEREPGDDTDEL